MKRRAIASATACAAMVAVLVSCNRNGAQQSGNMSLSAPLDKIERISFDLMPNDLPTDGKALQARTTAIRAELSAMSKVADPRKYGLKQIELAYAIRAKRVNATDALMQSGLQATDEASLIFSREKDPLIWAQIRALRASLFSMTVLFGMSSNQSGGMSPPAGQSPLENAQREADQALQVFTRNDYPLQYLEVKCDLSAAQTQKALVKEGAEKTRDNIRTTSYGTVVSNAQIPFCLPLVLGSGWTPTVQNVVSSPTLMALTSMGTTGDGVIRGASYSRAQILSSLLSWEGLGLSESEQQRSVTLFQRAGRAIQLGGRAGAGWRHNKTMWQAYAELYDISLHIKDASIEGVKGKTPAISPLVVDGKRGVVAFANGNGDGGTVELQLQKGSLEGNMLKGAADMMQKVMGQDPMAMLQELMKQCAQTGSAAADRSNSGDANCMERQIKSNLQNKLDTGEVDLHSALQMDSDIKVPASWSRDYARRRFVNAVDNFRAEFEEKWSPAIREAIAKAGIKPGERVLILPDGLSSMLPFGLLRDRKTGHTLIEDYEVVFAPSFDAYYAATKRAEGTQDATLAIAAPVYQAPIPTLPFTPSESNMVSRRFGSKVQQVGNNAGAALQVLGKAKYWHFATHGVFDQTSPRNSALILGTLQQTLSLNDLFAAPFIGHPRLVVLSACETGLFDAKFDPDAFVGLPTGFLQAGAAGVVASLWEVPDASTTLLMGKFYEMIFDKKVEPAAALRAAQIWLKNSSRSEIARFIKSQEQAGGLTQTQATDLNSEVEAAANDIPYSHPMYWGAFEYFGA